MSSSPPAGAGGGGSLKSPAGGATGTVTPAGDPPEPEELIKAIQDLENAASSDAAVREKISRLPPEVSEPSHLDKIETAEEGRELLTKVCLVWFSAVSQYNLRAVITEISYYEGTSSKLLT